MQIDIPTVASAAGYVGYLFGAAAAAVLAFRKGNRQTQIEAMRGKDDLIKSKDEIITDKNNSLTEWKERCQKEHDENKADRLLKHQQINDAQAIINEKTAIISKLEMKTDMAPVLEHMRAQTEQLIQLAGTSAKQNESMASISVTLARLHETMTELGKTNSRQRD